MALQASITPSITAPVIKANASYLCDLHAYRPITICWGHYLGDRTGNSGSASLSNLNTPTLTISNVGTFTAQTIKLVHEYWSLLTISGSNGRLEKFLSS